MAMAQRTTRREAVDPRATSRGQAPLVTVGVDTHADQHVAAALDDRGRLLGVSTIPTTPAGYAQLLTWASAYGSIERVGIEGTGTYGAGLARWCQRHSL